MGMEYLILEKIGTVFQVRVLGVWAIYSLTQEVINYYAYYILKASFH